MSAVEGHGAALEESWSKLAKLDMRLVASDSGAEIDGSSSVLKLKVIDGVCSVDVAAKKIECVGGSSESPNHHLQILILHYLLGAGNAQLANKPATYREFEGGALYYSAFKARTIDILVREFGVKPEILGKIGDSLHAEPLKSGSVAFKVDFFPKVPVTVVLWLGDEEVPASANILFDASAGKIMPTEDLSVLGGELVSRLVALATV